MTWNRLKVKKNLKQFKEALGQEFCLNQKINTVTQKLVRSTNEILLKLFHQRRLDQNDEFCLIALGSYGRNELQLYSDIDILLLHDENTPDQRLANAQAFIQDCWDIGLEVSHQITTVHACAELASQDLSVISSMLDARLLVGRSALMEELIYQTHPLHMWPSDDYFLAKQHEQKQRYKKYGETAYNLEPNVKYGAGGLRDIQVLLHIGKRHFKIKKLSEGIACGFLTPKEYDELLHCLHFLYRVRFALHLLAQKKEERLRFEYQLKLANLFGYQDTPHALAIEQFMKTYFKVIKRSRALNEMLLQWFAETIVDHQKQTLIPLDDAFQLSNEYLEAKHTKVFLNHPQALLRIFLWMTKRPDIRGIRANTIRLIRQYLYLLNKKFCASPHATDTFLAIFSHENTPYEALQRMNRYGVLGYYLKAFSAVTGQMQYDLFHVYTVDQHTLFVIRNLGRFLKTQFKEKFPLACDLMPKLPNRKILYLAALFHDIAKGRGGDHSELGAIEAQAFAKQHRLTQEEEQKLVWLVRHHLLMSQTAQRQDIYDPKTIRHFCKKFPNPDDLDALYLLTVADICATNPTLWNAWKDSLLKELYFAATQAFNHEKSLLDETILVESRRQKALDILLKKDIVPAAIHQLWQTFQTKYFLHQSPEIIARHTQAILTCQQFPLILIMPHHTQGGTEVFIYMPHRDDRFTITTTVLSNHQVTIQEATILTTEDQFDLDTYIILDKKNQSLLDEAYSNSIQHALSLNLANQTQRPNLSRRRLSRTQAHFKTNPKISFSDDSDTPFYTKLFLITADRPGLLARISQIFLIEHIHLHDAKIATVGERVEDMFSLSNRFGQALSAEEKNSLSQKLVSQLKCI